jgi:hypothetical protein
MSNYISSFPRQKIPQAKKNEKWAMECAKAAAEPIFQNNSNIRKSIRNKVTNYNLRINKINLEDQKVLFRYINNFRARGFEGDTILKVIENIKRYEK